MSRQLYVDQKNECVLVPVYGQMVPFHISMIRNVFKNESSGFTYLRINFVTPDMAFNASSKLSVHTPLISFQCKADRSP